MTREVIVPGWPEPKGYANGRVGEGRTLYVGGQIGWDEQRAFPPGGNARFSSQPIWPPTYSVRPSPTRPFA